MKSTTSVSIYNVIARNEQWIIAKLKSDRNYLNGMRFSIDHPWSCVYIRNTLHMGMPISSDFALRLRTLVVQHFLPKLPLP